MPSYLHSKKNRRYPSPNAVPKDFTLWCSCNSIESYKSMRFGASDSFDFECLEKWRDLFRKQRMGQKRLPNKKDARILSAKWKGESDEVGRIEKWLWLYGSSFGRVASAPGRSFDAAATPGCTHLRNSQERPPDTHVQDYDIRHSITWSKYPTILFLYLRMKVFLMHISHVMTLVTMYNVLG